MPRKPVQERSRATVDAIVEAGFVCVARHGIANTTTRHIADVAGIGVGSLYEYFANKEAVFDAMNERFVADIVRLIRELTPQLVTLDLEPALALLFRSFGEFLTADDERYLRVARQIANADAKNYIEPVSQALLDLLMQFVLRHPELIQLPDIQTMSYVLIHAGIFTVLHHLTSENPPISYEQLSQGFAALLSSYAEHQLAKRSAVPTTARPSGGRVPAKRTRRRA